MGFKLSAYFKQDSTFTSFHGGARWVADGLDFRIENGYWAPGSTVNAQAKSCRVSVNAGDYIIDEARNGSAYDWGAIPADTAWEETMRLDLQSPRAEDRAILLAVLATLHWGKQ